MKVFLRHLKHPDDNIEIKCDAEKMLGINNLKYADNSVSQVHARIFRRKDGIYIEDAGSRNGTTVRYCNQSSYDAKPGVPRKLENECVVYLGSSGYEVLIREGTDSEKSRGFSFSGIILATRSVADKFKDIINKLAKHGENEDGGDIS